MPIAFAQPIAGDASGADIPTLRYSGRKQGPRLWGHFLKCAKHALLIRWCGDSGSQLFRGDGLWRSGARPVRAREPAHTRRPKPCGWMPGACWLQRVRTVSADITHIPTCHISVRWLLHSCGYAPKWAGEHPRGASGRRSFLGQQFISSMIICALVVSVCSVYVRCNVWGKCCTTEVPSCHNFYDGSRSTLAFIV